MGLATVVALVSDFETAAQVVPELGRLGIARPDIHVTSGNMHGIRDFSQQLGISEVNLLDKNDPASHLFHERLPVSRAAYLKEQLHGKSELFVVPDVQAGTEVAGIFQRFGADFGPDVSELDNTEVRVPLRAERLNIEKYLVQSGSVRLRKEITTEVERFEVSLVREEFCD